MLAERWIYDFLIYVYAISLVFASSDLIQPNRKALRFSYWLLAIVWILQATVFALRSLEFFPMVTRFDSLFFYSWLLVTFSIIMIRLDSMPIFVFVMNLFGFIVLAINLFSARDVSPVVEHLLLSELVFVHVTMAVIAYAVFSMSSICAALYLVNNYLLKQKRWNYFLMRLPSLDRLQLFSKWLVMTGTLLLLISMILGMIYAYQTVGSSFWFDVKIWGSFWVLIVYGFVLIQWVSSRWHGRRLAWWNALSVLAIVLNYFLSNSSFSFHHWI